MAPRPEAQREARLHSLVLHWLPEGDRRQAAGGSRCLSTVGRTRSPARWRCDPALRCLSPASSDRRAAGARNSCDIGASDSSLDIAGRLSAEILCRASRYHEAIERLNQVERQTPEPDEAAPSSPAYAWFFLAMVHHRRGNNAEALEWHTRVSRYTDDALRSAAVGNPGAAPWNRGPTLRLLRDEAEAEIRPRPHRGSVTPTRSRHPSSRPSTTTTSPY